MLHEAARIRTGTQLHACLNTGALMRVCACRRLCVCLCVGPEQISLFRVIREANSGRHKVFRKGTECRSNAVSVRSVR